jgi:hypothetical protein
MKMMWKYSRSLVLLGILCFAVALLCSTVGYQYGTSSRYAGDGGGYIVLWSVVLPLAGCFAGAISLGAAINCANAEKLKHEDAGMWKHRMGDDVVPLERVRSDVYLIHVLQPKVDEVLTKLAALAIPAFYELNNAKRALKQCIALSEAATAIMRAKEYAKLHDFIPAQEKVVALRKSDFWNFHRICRDAGFTVRKKIGQYRPELKESDDDVPEATGQKSEVHETPLDFCR